jgi:hypothetical protein
MGVADNPAHKLVVIFEAASAIEAERARSVLEGSGFDAFVYDGHMAGLHQLFGGPLGAFRVAVPDDQVEGAREALRVSGFH